MRKILMLFVVLLLAFSCNKDKLNQIEKPSYTVTFILGQSNSKEERVVHGNTIQREDPIKANRVFTGWFKQSDNKKVDKRTPINENMTLVARFMGTIIIGNQVWLDRNLGATRVARNVTDTTIEACGNYYQWGRGNDGHEIYNSTISNIKISWNAKSDKFIKALGNWISGGSPIDKNYNSMNNPCPAGFMVPTKAQFQYLKTTIGGEKGKYHEAYFHALKMVKCGLRGFYFWHMDGLGDYWTSDSENNKNSYHFFFSNNIVSPPNTASSTTMGFSVRCIKE